MQDYRLKSMKSAHNSCQLSPNKRMQTDRSTRYADETAADAKRYSEKVIHD